MNKNQKLVRYNHLAERFRSHINGGDPATISEAEDDERIRLHYELNINGASDEREKWSQQPDLNISSSLGVGMTIRQHSGNKKKPG